MYLLSGTHTKVILVYLGEKSVELTSVLHGQGSSARSRLGPVVAAPAVPRNFLPRLVTGQSGSAPFSHPGPRVDEQLPLVDRL